MMSKLKAQVMCVSNFSKDENLVLLGFIWRFEIVFTWRLTELKP
jgi:hypothetical protein